MLSALSEAGAEYLIVGAHAMAAHGRPRATGDLDIWVRATPANAARVWRALQQFGAPLFDLEVDDLATPDVVFQVGVPPCRIDILTQISGVDFEHAWSRRVTLTIEGRAVPFLSKEDLLANKRALGRAKDLGDIAFLEGRED
jgi:hypothetical protein